VNRGHSEIENLTKTISEVMDRLRDEEGRDIDEIWRQIDNAIVLTVLAGYDYIHAATANLLSFSPYSKCFQILGFDVLLDQNCKPAILEVNYRPSLESDTVYEHDLKQQMLSDALKIALPSKGLQRHIDASAAFIPGRIPSEFLIPPTYLGDFRCVFSSDFISNWAWNNVFLTMREMGAPRDMWGKPSPGAGVPGWRPKGEYLTVKIESRDDSVISKLGSVISPPIVRLKPEIQGIHIVNIASEPQMMPRMPKITAPHVTHKIRRQSVTVRTRW
jgi:hypothetical protein